MTGPGTARNIMFSINSETSVPSALMFALYPEEPQ